MPLLCAVVMMMIGLLLLPHRNSRVRMQTPSAAAKKSAAKSVSHPRGRTMTRSASRGASRACSPQAAVYAR